MSSSFSYEENATRLRGLVAIKKSMRKASEFLGINNYYLSNYLNPEKVAQGDHEPTKKTQTGRAARKALGIVDNQLQSTRSRISWLDEYAISKGYKSWSNAGTMAFSQGFDVLKDHPKKESK